MSFPARLGSLEPSPLFNEQEADYARLRAQARAQYEHQRKVSLNARSIAPFFANALVPGFDMSAKLLTSLTLHFDKPVGSQLIEQRTLGAEALKVMSNLEDLTITGLADPNKDGTILRGCVVMLKRFSTDLSFLSPTVINFLKEQRELEDLELMPHPRHMQILPERDFPELSMPEGQMILKSLKILRCEGAFLLLLGRSCLKDAPPIISLRLDLNTDGSYWKQAIEGIAHFSMTLESLSLRLSTVKERIELQEPTECFATPNPAWAHLLFLEIRGTVYSRAARKKFLKCIDKQFPKIQYLIWVPHAINTSDGHRLHPASVASKFLVQCPKLRRFVFVGPDVGTLILAPKYASHMKVERKGLYEEGHMGSLEDSWKNGAVCLDCDRGINEGSH